MRVQSEKEGAVYDPEKVFEFESKIPIIIAGDLNVEPNDPPFILLCEGFFTKAAFNRYPAYLKPFKKAKTFRNKLKSAYEFLEFPPTLKKQAIDHILFSEHLELFSLLDLKQIEVKSNRPSDHFPIMAQFVFN